MTTYFRRRVTCSVCGTQSEHTEIGSTNTLGGFRDLDTRPPEMMRSTITHWVQRCPNCGYATSDISDDTTATEDWLKSDEYLSHDGILPDDWPDDCLELMFYRAHKVALHDEKKDTAALSLLHAAWACDDLGEKDYARLLRRKSVPIFKGLLRDEPDNDSLRLMILDIERRAGMFDQVREEYHEGMFGSDFADKIVAFQLQRAKNGDDRPFSTGHVTGNLPVIDLATERQMEDLLHRIKNELERKFHSTEELVLEWIENMIDRMEEHGYADDSELLSVLQAELDALHEENENRPEAQVLREHGEGQKPEQSPKENTEAPSQTREPSSSDSQAETDNRKTQD